MYNKCCDEWDKRPDCDERPDYDKKTECNIKSECCQGFVKQQFSITATATADDGTVVYRNSNNFAVTGTIILTNLGRRNITLTAGDKQIIVPPNDMGVIIAANIDHVTINTTTTNTTSRALLCFDIQVPSPEFECCSQ